MTSVDLPSEQGGLNTDNESERGNRRNRFPEKCAACPFKLYVGISLFVYACHTHAMCSACDFPEARSQHGCPFCEEEIARKVKTHSCPPPKVRNSLIPIQVAPTEGVAIAQSSLLYRYSPLISTPSASALTYDKTIKIENTIDACWSAGENDTIIVPGRNKQKQPTLTTVSTTRTSATHVLSFGREIISGAFVTMLTHIICMNYSTRLKTCDNKIHIVLLDSSTTVSTINNPHMTIDAFNPMFVFRKSRQMYGVLCMEGSSSEYKNVRMRLLGLNQLVLAKDTDPCTQQSTALWGCRTLIHLDVPAPFINDTVAVTQNSYLCIASYWRGEIQVYGAAGRYKFTVGELGSEEIHPGKLTNITSIQCMHDNRLMLTEQPGAVHSYNMSSGTGKLVPKKYGHVKDDDDNGNEEYNSNGKRRIYYFREDPAGWRILRGDITKGVYRSAITRTRCWEMTSRKTVALHKITN